MEFVVNSEAVRRELIEADRVPPQLIHLYNGIDAAFFESRGRPARGPIAIGVICALRLESMLGTVEGAFEALLKFKGLIDEAIGHVVEAEEGFAAVGAREFLITPASRRKQANNGRAAGSVFPRSRKASGKTRSTIPSIVR